MLGVATVLLAASGHLPSSAVIRHPAVVPARARAPILQQSDQKEETKRRFPLPFLQPNVPADQQPTTEMRTLRGQPFMDWADDDEYTGKLSTLYQAITLFLSLPIAYTTFYNLPEELPELLVAANIGTTVAMVPFVLRLRIAWGFVSSRLKARTTYYEANQRGYEAKKDKGDLLRDRLVEETQVRPILERVDRSLFALTLAVALSFASAEVVTAVRGDAAPATLKTLVGDDARRFDNRLRGDDDFAREQQRRAQARDPNDIKPAYCDSRYYKILAGGNGQGGVGCAK